MLSDRDALITILVSGEFHQWRRVTPANVREAFAAAKVIADTVDQIDREQREAAQKRVTGTGG